MERRTLGTTGIEVTPIGLGCWQFSQGKGMAGKFWRPVRDDAMNAIVAAALAGGVSWFDTAEIYGNGASEAALARALEAAGNPQGVTIATKWWPMLRRAKSIGQTIAERRRLLGGRVIDLYQVHQPFGLSSVEAEMRAMAALVSDGQIRAVGVSNFDARRMRRAHAALAEAGVPLAANQMKYSILDRRIERNGVLAAAKELGITIIAYSPLEQGVVTGRFHDDRGAARRLAPARRFMPTYRRGRLERSRPVVEELRAVAQAHGATPSQVALAWLVARHAPHVVAIPGASRPEQAEENAGALGLALSPREVTRLDEVSSAIS